MQQVEPAATFVTNLLAGLPNNFRSFYGRNSNKKWPKWLFFEEILAKNAKCFYYGNLYNHSLGNSKYYEGTIFLPKRSGLAKEASFEPKTAISVMNSGFRTTTCYSLS